MLVFVLSVDNLFWGKLVSAKGINGGVTSSILQRIGAEAPVKLTQY